jgi:hypothetical protein
MEIQSKPFVPPEPGRYYLSARVELLDEAQRFGPRSPDGLPPLPLLPRVDTIRVPAGSVDLNRAWTR